MPRPYGHAAPILSVLLGATLVAGCGTGRPEPAAAPSGSAILHLVLAGDPPTLNPMLAQDALAFDVLNQTMEGLTREDASGDAQPGIASSWQTSDGGLTWTFHLRSARWNNGDPVQASDFVYAWRQALDPRTGSPYQGELRYLAGAKAVLQLPAPPNQTKAPQAYQSYLQSEGPKIDALLNAVGVSAPDAHTLVVHLAQPTPYWLGLTSLPVYYPEDQHALAAWAAGKYGTDAPYTLSDGPFSVSTWTHGASLDLRANPDYWDAAHVHLAGVHFEIVSDTNTVENLYDTKAIDALIPTVPHGTESQYQAEPGFQTAPELSVDGVLFNAHNPLLADVHIRRALSEAIDRTSLVQGVVKANAAPASVLIPPSVVYAQGKSIGGLVPPELPTSANATQARNDWKQGLADLHLSTAPALSLVIPNAGGAPDEAAAIQSMWQQTLGIQVNIQAVDPNTWVHQLVSGQFQQCIFWSWNADYDDPETFLDIFRSSDPENFGHWNDAAFDAAMSQAAAASDLQTRGKDLAAAEEELLKQVPIAPLWFPVRNWIAQPNVQGIEILPTGPDYDLKNVSIQG